MDGSADKEEEIGMVILRNVVFTIVFFIKDQINKEPHTLLFALVGVRIY